MVYHHHHHHICISESVSLLFQIPGPQTPDTSTIPLPSENIREKNKIDKNLIVRTYGIH